MSGGFVHLSTVQTWLIIFASMEMTILAVSLYLHRSQSHASVSFHPLVEHVFRLWLWMNSIGVITRQWVAVHRKHHAKTDTAEDPHSPQAVGLRKVFFLGSLMYRKAARDKELFQMYGARTRADDWLDRLLYVRHRFVGPPFFLVIEMVVFGAGTGALIWFAQIMTMPLVASGIVNGFAHTFGYRNTETRDASHNLLPVGLFLAGEELHNNHHASPGSAKLSMKWWEFDMGWAIIRLLAFLQLAKINKV